jgi:hypothetical protein
LAEKEREELIVGLGFWWSPAKCGQITISGDDLGVSKGNGMVDGMHLDEGSDVDSVDI